MTAFAAAAATMLRDPHVATTVEVRPVGGAWRSIRAVFVRGEVNGFDVAMAEPALYAAAADVADLARTAAVRFADGAMFVVQARAPAGGELARVALQAA